MSWRIRAGIGIALAATAGVTLFTVLPGTAGPQTRKHARRGLKRGRSQRQQVAQLPDGQRVALTRSDFEEPAAAATSPGAPAAPADSRQAPRAAGPGDPAPSAAPGAAGKKKDRPRAGKGIRGRITRLIPNGFEMRTGGKGVSLPVTLRVTVNSGTRMFEVRRGSAGDLKPDLLVALQMPPPAAGAAAPAPAADGMLHPEGIVALWPASLGAVGLTGAPGDSGDQTRQALMVAAGARRALGDLKKKDGSGGSGATGKKTGVLNLGPAGGDSNRKAGAGSSSAPAARKKGNRPTLGRVVSVNPLQVMVEGGPVTVATPRETRIAVAHPIGLKGLKVGEGVALAIQGEANLPAAGSTAPLDVVAALVVRAPGAQSREQMNKKTLETKQRIRRDNRRKK